MQTLYFSHFQHPVSSSLCGLRKAAYVVRVGAHMGLYGPLWAHMGPYGTSWIGLGRLRKLSVRLLEEFRTFRVQNLLFDEIAR